MNARELRQLRHVVEHTRCPDCNRYRLNIQEVRDGAASVLCAACGWFEAKFVVAP